MRIVWTVGSKILVVHKIRSNWKVDCGHGVVSSSWTAVRVVSCQLITLPVLCCCYWRCPHSMWSTVYDVVGCLCVCLSHRLTTAVVFGGFAAERHIDWPWWVPGTQQQRCRSTVLSSKCGQCYVHGWVDEAERRLVSIRFHFYSRSARMWWAYLSVCASVCHAFGALTVLVGHHKEHPACKNWVMRCWYGCVSRAVLFCDGTSWYGVPETDDWLTIFLLA